MPARVIPTQTEIIIGDRLVVLDGPQLLSMPTVDLNKAGVVLANERVKAYITDDNGVPVEFTVSLYVQRSARSEAEAEGVAKVADERKANAQAKKQEENDRLAREKRAAFELGQESTFGALRNLETLHAASVSLAKLAK